MEVVERARGDVSRRWRLVCKAVALASADLFKIYLWGRT